MAIPEWVGDDSDSGAPLYPVTVLAVPYKNGTFSGSNSKVKYVVMPSVTNIAANTFMWNTKLESVEAPSLISISVGTVFSGCTALKDISMRNLRVLQNKPFDGCASLKNIQFVKLTYVGGHGTGDGYAFSGCSGLECLQLPLLESFISSSGAFQHCPSLTNLVFARLKTGDDFNGASGALKNTPSLKEVKLPYCTTKFNAPNVTNYFLHRASSLAPDTECKNMKSWTGTNYVVNLYGNYKDDEETGIRWIYEYLPSETDRQSILLLDAIKIPGTTIEDAPNWGATTKIPETFEDLPVTIIQYGAFTDQTMSKVKLPATVTEIRYGAFSDCPNLTEIVAPKALTQDAELRESLNENNLDRAEIILTPLGGGFSVIVR